MPLCTDNSIIIDGDTVILNIPKDLKKFFKSLDKKKNKGELENIKKVELNALNGYELNFELSEYFPKMEHFESEDLKEIGDNVFADCANLKTISLPKVIRIGKKSFCRCNSLLSVSMDNLKTIGESCFMSCNNLVSVKMKNLESITENDNFSSLFGGCTSLKEVHMPKLKEICDSTFFDCTALENIELNGVKKVKYECPFVNCRNLKTVEMNSLEKIENTHLFEACPKLTKVSMMKITIKGMPDKLVKDMKVFPHNFYVPDDYAILDKISQSIDYNNIAPKGLDHHNLEYLDSDADFFENITPIKSNKD